MADLGAAERVATTNESVRAGGHRREHQDSGVTSGPSHGQLPVHDRIAIVLHAIAVYEPIDTR